MLNKLISVLVFGLLISCSNTTNNSQQTAPEETAPGKEGIYGAQIGGENPISGKDMVAMLEDNDSVYVTLKSKIVSNCQKSGCWMDLDLGNDEVVKVTFKDYAFFIPLDSKGKTATIEGVAKREIPVDLLKHYAEDEGQSEEEIAAITQDEIAYTFEAVGVIIED